MKKILSSKVSGFLKYRSLKWIKAKELYFSQIAYANIGEEINGKNAPRALMIVPTESIDFYVQNRYEEAMSASMHNIYFQFLAILKKLVDRGFVVDCVEKDTLQPTVDTSVYQLILDEGDTLAYLPKVDGQTRIFYCTGTKWNRWNEDELRRIDWLRQEYGLFVKPRRQIRPIYSDQAADYILYKGVPEQMWDFNPEAELVQLAMPVEFEPKDVVRGFSQREFAWVGGWGAIHKGLDLVIDAFEKMPDLQLNIFGAIEREEYVMKWLEGKLAANKNLHYHGYADCRSVAFQEILFKCVGNIYPSAGENGCATLAQTAHFGLIPITTATANNQANFLGYNITGTKRNEMIDSICESVKTIAAMEDKEIQERAFAVMEFAKKRFTREAFISSFDDFLVNSKLVPKR